MGLQDHESINGAGDQNQNRDVFHKVGFYESLPRSRPGSECISLVPVSDLFLCNVIQSTIFVLLSVNTLICTHPFTAVSDISMCRPIITMTCHPSFIVTNRIVITSPSLTDPVSH